MNITRVKDSKDVRAFFRNLFELMATYDGTTNSTDVVDYTTGEILVWSNKEPYTANYALIDLVSEGTLCPNSKKVVDKMRASAELQTVSLIKYYDDSFVVTAYAGEIRNVVTTMGLCVRKIDKKVTL